MCRYINFWNNRLAELLAANSMEAFDILLFVLLFQTLYAGKQNAECRMQNFLKILKLKVFTYFLVLKTFQDILKLNNNNLSVGSFLQVVGKALFQPLNMNKIVWMYGNCLALHQRGEHKIESSLWNLLMPYPHMKRLSTLQRLMVTRFSFQLLSMTIHLRLSRN